MLKLHETKRVQTVIGAPEQDGLQGDRCCVMARRNLWEMLLFIVVSIYAYAIKDISLFELASEPLRQILGYPPPAYMVSIALAVYCFSAVSLTLTAIAKGIRPEQKWHQIGYRSAFYFFYSFSGAIGANFVAVLIVGLLLYSLDHYHIWIYNTHFENQDKNLERKI